MERRLFDGDQLERIYQSAIRVLSEMGMKVENRACLEAMERFGCRIDYPNERALFSREVLDRMLEMVRADNAGWERGFARQHANYGAAGGGTCPFYLDEDRGERRRGSEQDCIQALKIMESSNVAACEVPVSNGDCSPKFEAIRCLQLGIETLKNTVLCSTDLFHPEQVPYVVELGVLYKNDPAWFLPAGNCPVSPLTVSKIIADLAVAKAPYPVRYGVATMPVMGANAPITPAGAAVIGVAEILGGYVLAKSLNPQTPVCSSALSALMDMKSGSIVYVAPEVFAADIAIAETFELHVGLPCIVHGNYIDAKLPGMRSVHERLVRCLGLGLYSNISGMQGTLDQGKVFSPTQLVLDYDIHRLLVAYTAEPAVDADSLGVDAILEVGWDGTGYLVHDHTIRHMRETWQSLIYGRAPWVSLEEEQSRESQQLERARQTWRDNLSRYEPPDHPDDFLRELRAISEKARKALS